MSVSKYPQTDLVILAAGQGRRMNGRDKLLQSFDDQIQLTKIYQRFKTQVEQVWINTFRDCSIYTRMFSDLRCYADDEAGFMGPLMGMKSAWSHLRADYVLFVPCDLTYIPEDVLEKLHMTLFENPCSHVAFVTINGQPLYPFCLIKRDAMEILEQQIVADRLSLRNCFELCRAESVIFNKENLSFHSINSFDELKIYQKNSR